jgi:hypothetical protein
VLEFAIDERPPQALAACVRDEGPGIAAIEERCSAAAGTVPRAWARGRPRLVDRLDVESTRGQGTTVWIRKHLPPTTRPLDSRTVRELSASLARERSDDVATELQQQNRELGAGAGGAAGPARRLDA